MTWSGFLLPEGAGWMSHQLTIIIYEMTYAICRLQPNAAAPVWAAGERFLSITRTANELSIVCEEKMVPADVHGERNRRLMQIEGTLAFTLTGVLASVAAPLASAGISVFAVSTYDTDYLLVSDEDLQEAARVLESAGHTIRQNPPI
jgi:hypothetical protein